MAEKCKASYKNLNLIQSFSEQGYATIQLMQQACMNDEWLRQYCERLNYLSPPAVRRWFQTSAMMDKEKSWGCRRTSAGNIVFDNQTQLKVDIDFSDDSQIDWDKTTANIVSYVQDETEINGVPYVTEIAYDDGVQLPSEVFPVPDNYNKDKGVRYRCQLHTRLHYEPEKYDYSTRTAHANTGVNSAWYVGFDKSKNYYVRPDWIADWRDEEIPSVCRAQTFVAKKSGWLDSIDLNLDYTGTMTSNCGSPLYVQIWKTVAKKVQQTRWNTQKYEMELVYDNNGEPVMENVAWLDTENSGIYNPLTEAVFDPSSMTHWGFPNIKFNKPVQVTKGNSYAIVLFSPLSEWAHCPRWGGWGRNCREDKKYLDGYAFLSEDNGRTWMRFGKNEDRSLEYKYGKYVPQDFAFQCHIKTSSVQADSYYVENEEWVYFKPIFTNPINEVIFSFDDNVMLQNGAYITYSYSTNGRDWTEIQDKTGTLKLSKERVFFLRAKLWRASSQVNNSDPYAHISPKIENISLHFHTDEALEFYLRTNYYQAKIGEMLGASLWGRIYAPFVYRGPQDDNQVECTVEIIQSLEPTDHFKIITIEEAYDTLVELNNTKIKKKEEGPFADEIIAINQVLSRNTYTNEVLHRRRDIELISNYLSQNPVVLDKLKDYSVYIKPSIVSTLSASRNAYNPWIGVLYNFSFAIDNDSLIVNMDGDPYAEGNTTLDEKRNTLIGVSYNRTIGGLSFKNNVASPIIECMMYPEVSDATAIGYGEWYDYTFDYTNNELIFDYEVLDAMPSGSLNVTYNKIFIDGLKKEEVGVHTDPETGIQEEGLILDYFKETIPLTTEHVANRSVPLRAEPVDPIREVFIDKDTEDEKELYEDFDFTLDINTNSLIFKNLGGEDNNASVLKDGSELTVVYTPNLDDDRICLGYHAKRINTKSNVQISSNYIEYKV